MENKYHQRVTFLLSFTIALTVIFIASLIILVKPAFVGYSVIKQLKESGKSPSNLLDEFGSLKSQNSVLNNELESCKAQNKAYLRDIYDERNAGISCLEDNNKVRAEIKQLKMDSQNNLSIVNIALEKTRTELELKKGELDEIKQYYAKVIQNSANNICCKARVDDKSIDSYVLSDGKIICKSGEQLKISC